VAINTSISLLQGSRQPVVLVDATTQPLLIEVALNLRGQRMSPNSARRCCSWIRI